MTLRLPYKIKSYNYVSVQTTNHYHKKPFREKVYKEFYTLNSKTIDIYMGYIRSYMTSTLMHYVFQCQLPNCRAGALTMYCALK